MQETLPRNIEGESVERVMNNDNINFTERVLKLNALTSINLKSENYDTEKTIITIREDLNALSATGGLQQMLAAQMLSIHQMQQIAIAMANDTDILSYKQYYLNSATKLSNTFIQQANLLTKLQGNGQQKIIVEHVDVHAGGQAIVGVTSPMTSKEK